MGKTYDKFGCRAVDFCISLIVVILVLPFLYIILGIIIKLTSVGPIIFTQVRFGKDENPFLIYKFRSMFHKVNRGLVISANDCRITPIGRFLRKTHLDEFPQFFNVLIGNMQIVGPRPLSYRVKSEYKKRHLTKPGITGLAQVNSSRNREEKESFEDDLSYLTKKSFFYDLKIIAKTLTFSDKSF